MKDEKRGAADLQNSNVLKLKKFKRITYTLGALNIIMILVFSLIIKFNIVHAASILDIVRGRILLQVEQHGEAWYVDPVSNKRYYMKDGDAAYQIMRKLSLGITDVDLARIPAGQIDTADGCTAIVNSSFQSVNQYERGLSPTGIATTGYWSLTFQGNNANWSHSDVSESAFYTCSNGTIQTKMSNRTITAHYDSGLGVLTWDGVIYKKIACNGGSLGQACNSWSQGVGGGDTCCGGLRCDGSGPDGTTGKCAALQY